MRSRISEELALLRETFGEVDHKEADGNDWFRIKRYPFPSGWTKDDKPIAEDEIIFNANASYPTGDPYAFWTSSNVKFNGQSPNNVTEVETTPFGDKRLQFSWAPDGTWLPGSTIKGGPNLVAVTGMRPPRRHIEYRGQVPAVRVRNDPPHPNCPVCSQRGTGALAEVERYLALRHVIERRVQKVGSSRPVTK